MTIVRIELFLKFTLDINGLKILSTCSSIRWIRTKHKTKWRKTRIQTENEKKNVFEFFTQIKFVVTSITHISTHYFRLFCFSRMEFNLAKWKKNRSLLPLLLAVGWILCCCFFLYFYNCWIWNSVFIQRRKYRYTFQNAKKNGSHFLLGTLCTSKQSNGDYTTDTVIRWGFNPEWKRVTKMLCSVYKIAQPLVSLIQFAIANGTSNLLL